MAKKSYSIAVIAGDGVGPEVIGEGIKVLDAVSEKHDFKLRWVHYPFGSRHYLETGELVSEESLRKVGGHDSIFLGALGDPKVKPGVLEQGILLALRFYFDQYVNLRPVKLLPNIPCPLKDKTPKDIDFTVIRENTEDFYVGVGGRMRKGKSKASLEILRELYKIKFNLDIDSESEEAAYQLGLVTKEGCERVIEYGFKLAEQEGKTKVTSVDKANVLTNVYGFWREVFEIVGKKYPKIEKEYLLVDAITMFFVRNPERFQVVVSPNMFGDIITDLGAAIQGGMGVAASGNINPDKISMFEPVHGSAPDIAGKGIANPLATISAGSMMLGSLGEVEAAADVDNALSLVLSEGRVRTMDFGGKSKTAEFGDAVAGKIRLL